MALQNLLLLGLLLVLTFIGSHAAADGPVCPSTTKLSRASFPKGFIFGTATAAFQVQCMTLAVDRPYGMFIVRNIQANARATMPMKRLISFFHRYKEDIQLMKSLNTDAFRLSIAWSRIIPFGKKKYGVNRAGVQFYHDLIDELLKNDIMPSVTLFHWDTPQYLEYEYGGFLNESIVKDFRDYAEIIFEEFGHKVKHWVTLNDYEPWVYAHAGYDNGKKAPGRCSHYVDTTCIEGKSGHETYIVTHNLLNAHAEAVEAFRKCEKPTITGEYPEIMRKDLRERLPEFTDEQKAKLKNSADFLGINYYSATFSDHVEEPDDSKPTFRQDARVSWNGTNKDKLAIGSRPDTAAMPIYSRGFREILKHVKDTYGNPEVIIMENGYGEFLKEEDSVEVGTKDYNRMYYLQRHLLAMYEAICIDKVNVTGYFFWSLVDNFEWDNGYKSRFGLYYIDYKKNLKRHEKESAKYYREFLSQGVRPSLIKRDEL